MGHRFEKVTHSTLGHELELPQYLYRGFRIENQSWKNRFGWWVATEKGSCKRVTHNTRKRVKFEIDNFLDGAQS
jgi:hypothetical protein